VLNQEGLHSASSEVSFLTAGEGDIESHVAVTDEPGSIKIKVTPLDEVIKPIDGQFVMCKLDIEGSERAALEGAKKLLCCDNCVFISELNDVMLRAQGSNATEVIELFLSHGFTAWSDEGQRIVAHNPAWEPWKNAWFLKGHEAHKRYEIARRSICS
jgi:hypothetical protein